MNCERFLILAGSGWQPWETFDAVLNISYQLVVYHSATETLEFWNQVYIYRRNHNGRSNTNSVRSQLWQRMLMNREGTFAPAVLKCQLLWGNIENALSGSQTKCIYIHTYICTAVLWHAHEKITVIGLELRKNY